MSPISVSPSSVPHSDSRWLVINKPWGISTHGAFEGDLAMQEWVALHWGEELYVCSRLDKGTSGVLPLARTAEASAEAEQVHQAELAEKRYLLLSRRCREGEWTIDVPVDGKEASTRFRALGRKGNEFLYEAFIRRGRTHQIRRHASASGISILGDEEYGGPPAVRLYLHCAEVRWPGQGQAWCAPTPLSFDHPLRGSGFPEALDRRLELPASVATAWRVVHRGEVRGLDCAVDLYGKHLCVWLYGEAEPSAREREWERVVPMVSELLSRLNARGAVVKFPQRNPHSRKWVVEHRLLGEPPPAEFFVEEHGLRFGVSLTERQHVGLFLDQRDSRRMVAHAAQGKKVANLFSFTCSFSVAALAGGAECVFSVDASKKILGLGMANVEANGLTEGRRGKFAAEDVRVWLERQSRKIQREGDGARCDLVVCDPPTFSSTEHGNFAVETEWERLAAGVAAVMAQGGLALFSTNHRMGDNDLYSNVLKRHFGRVVRRSAPIDFPMGDDRKEHVKMFLCGASSRAERSVP